MRLHTVFKGVNMKVSYYVYAHLDKAGNCKYIGFGKRDRAWNFEWRSKIWKTFFKDYEPKVVLLEKGLTKEQAIELERAFIADFLDNGHELLNVYSGHPVKGERDEFAFQFFSKLRSGENHYSYGKPRPKWIMEKLKAAQMLKCPKPRLGAKLTEEHKQKLHAASKTPEALAKMAAAKRGKPLSEEHKAKLSAARKGRAIPEETKKKMSEAQKGRPSPFKGKTMPQEWRDAISKATKGRRPLTAEEQARRLATWKARGGTTSKAKAVLCVETGIVYRCAKDAAEAMGGNDKHIQACCVKRRKSHRGYTWQYADS